jgi:hypothetical protein
MALDEKETNVKGLKEKLGLIARTVAAALCLAYSLAAVSGDGNPAAAPPGSLNVTQFGATGNGSTDDTAAIKKAIAALPATGGTIYFPCGTYAVSSKLTINISSTTVTGPSSDCVTLKAIGAASFSILDVRGPGEGARANLVADATGNTFRVPPGALAHMRAGQGRYALISDTPVESNGPGSPAMANRQVVKITQVQGDSATVEGGFSYPFSLVSPHPQQHGGNPFAVIVDMNTNISVAHLAFDGRANSGSGTGALLMANVVDSTAAYLRATNFLKKAPTFLFTTGYNNSVHDIVCSQCGNEGGEAVWNASQSHLTESNVTITQSPSQRVISWSLREVHWSVVSDIYVDAKGAFGRVVKLQRSDHNTLNKVTALNGTGREHGICITDISQYNTFNDCVAQYMDGGGIVLFGNFNQHNTFNNCTSQYNMGGQFGQSRDSFGHYEDSFTTINGGFYGNQRGNSRVNLVNVLVHDFTMTGATVSDDNHVAGAGLVLRSDVPNSSGSINAAVTNNTFRGLPPKFDIFVLGTPSGHFQNNSTPDGTTPRQLPR